MEQPIALANERWLTSLHARDLLAAEPALRHLEAPTLIVWGTGDQFFDVKWAYRLADTLPTMTRVVEVPHAGPFFPDERAPELVAHLDADWMTTSTREL